MQSIACSYIQHTHRKILESRILVSSSFSFNLRFVAGRRSAPLAAKCSGMFISWLITACLVPVQLDDQSFFHCKWHHLTFTSQPEGWASPSCLQRGLTVSSQSYIQLSGSVTSPKWFNYLHWLLSVWSGSWNTQRFTHNTEFLIVPWHEARQAAEKWDFSCSFSVLCSETDCRRRKKKDQVVNEQLTSLFSNTRDVWVLIFILRSQPNNAQSSLIKSQWTKLFFHDASACRKTTTARLFGLLQ